MAISSWMIWGRSLRSSRPHRSRQDNEDRCVKLDLSKGLNENIKEALTNLCQRQGVSAGKKLAYLNAFVKLIRENDANDFGYSVEQLFCCLRVGLIHEVTQVRAAALRAVRYMLKKEQDVVSINKLQYPYFLARSMDVNLRTEMERIQALRLVRRILVLAPRYFSPALARSLISLTNGGIDEKDRGFHAFFSTLCELGVLNSNLLINCSGISTLARAAMNGQSPSIIESAVGVLLKLLSTPETRNHVSLFCLATPYCELHSPGLERPSEDRQQKFTASKHALLSVLRSYSGVIHFCNPNHTSGLKSIVNILYVEQQDVRGAVLELFYELLGIPLPLWTDEPDVALSAVDPNRVRETWKLSEGFIAAEGKTILPSLMSRSPNITEMHLALLVYVLLECGLHKALAEAIVTSDTFICVRAAILLGGLLHLSHSLLPPEVCDLTPPLPNLVIHASRGKHQALAAVTILGRMHSMMRERPSPTSLFLDRMIQGGNWLRSTIPKTDIPVTPKNWLRRETSSAALLKKSQVLTTRDVLAWNWPIIRAILHSREDYFKLLHDTDHRLFIKKLIRYFKPSSNQFSRIELGRTATLARESTLAGSHLIICLLEIPEPDSTRFLNELIADIANEITAIRTAQSAHDCLFSPRHMSTTCCQKYFLFLGQMSHSAKGTVILKSFNLLQKLQELAISTNHDCYVKLIMSSLDYTGNGVNRKVMNKIISESSLESTRLYATQFLRCILRAKMKDAFQWAITILSERLSDTSKAVASAALDILHEACEEPHYLEVFFQQNKDWDRILMNLGDRGYLLKIRLYSLKSGFASLSSPSEELEKWIKTGGFAERYVGLIEGEIHDSLTRRQRGENGSYMRRNTNIPISPRDAFIPPHLIGQLVQHELGLQLLMRRNVLQRFARVVQRFRYEYGVTEQEMSMKNMKSSRSIIEDSYLVSEESGTDEAAESTRLETIIDSEIMELSESQTPQKADSLVEIRRKLSLDESRRTTPERSWKGDLESREENSSLNFEGRLLRVKAALWVLGHAGLSAEGMEQLKNLGIIEMLTLMAETCPYYVVRATAMYSLSLVSTNRAGADVLTTLNWPCVRFKRGEEWPIVQHCAPCQSPSPPPVQRHHRSLSDGKPEFPEPVIRRTRNRSESAATELEVRRLILPERGETPSPVSSVQRLSQQDAEGYARLRTIQRYRRPSFSQSSLEMYSSDGRLSLQSLSEFEFSRSWIAESILSSTPPPPTLPPPIDNDNSSYMGICLPRKLTTMFPNPVRPLSKGRLEEKSKIHVDPSGADEESNSEYDVAGDHSRVCLICYSGTNNIKDSDLDSKITRDIFKHVQRLANPVLYKHSKQTLLTLRQRHPEKFQNVCIFSEVSARLGNNTYRIPARRFLQELFLDSSFDALYKEPAEILSITLDIEEKSVPTSPSDNSRLSAKPSETKINGRVTPSCLQNDPLSSVQEEATTTGGQPRIVYPQNKKETALIAERLSDEKIIAEILKPEERIRVAKSSEKILKVTGTNTAINLE
ncbi:rapamycin-insensitive companion of mTOR [Leptopilina heterotoma]|uniref:rapamycin-insensitive companion of mTOR n=1 Tax=Leptopilina heterotoma TaxID=63436 RepID=UPI001CA98C8D|nr:rapamycin-insensitive companion of mTOR [Leptopilina heterotoma]